jgi:hypothetical protein
MHPAQAQNPISIKECGLPNYLGKPVVFLGLPDGFASLF